MRNTLLIKQFFLMLLLLAGANAQSQSLLDSDSSLSTEMAPKATPVEVFKSSWLISGQTVEQPRAHILEFRVAHRFGDLAGKSGGYHTFYGFDDAKDIYIGFEYGLTNRLAISGARSKAGGDLKELWTAGARFRLAEQAESGSPVSVSISGNTALSSMSVSPFSTGPGFENQPFLHRGANSLQVMAARRFSERVSLQLAPLWAWANYVAYDDANGVLLLPISGRIGLTRVMSFAFEYAPQLMATKNTSRGTGPVFWNSKEHDGRLWQAPLHLGLEFATGGGHVFAVNITNTSGIQALDWAHYSPGRWEKGQYRFGFTILREFHLGGKRKRSKA